jgi:integrase
VLKRPWTVADTPYPKRPDKLPVVLSQDEVARLIDAALTPLHRAVLMTLYATGLRRAELTRLKVTDIDTERMVIHVLGGKGRKDRDVMLSPRLLEELRQYWRGLKNKPRTWLFPGGRWHGRTEQPMSDKVVWYACEQAAKRAGIDKAIHPHTLRHASAYCTTFQSRFILKTIGLGRARFVGVYGRLAGQLSPAPAPLVTASHLSR